MSIRRFQHYFSPVDQGTGGSAYIELSTTEIADAAALEITQLGLGSAPFALLVDQLLVPDDPWFRWQSPLGQVRETKTALSGLFGRFVARAYLTKYLGFTYFEPIRSNLQLLAGWPNIRVIRSHPGDLPDWIATDASQIAVVEAKGSHNGAGPDASLAAAKVQATRVNVLAGNTTLQVKRYAIATRWAVDQVPKLSLPWLVVHDPIDGQRPATPREQSQLIRSIALGHFAALLEGLQLHQLARRLQSAKLSAPTSIGLPAIDLVNAKQEGRDAELVAAGVVTPTGVFALPNEEDLETFRAAILTISRGQALLLGVPVETLLQILRGDKLDGEKHTGSELSEHEPEFWKKERRRRDGSLLLPLSGVTLTRAPPTST